MDFSSTTAPSHKQTIGTGAQTTSGSRPRRLARLAIAAIATTCVSISTVAMSGTESFDFADFNALSAAEGIHMYVTMGEVFKVTAESADARQLEYLELDVRRGTLRAEMDSGLLSPDGSPGTR